jgi:hypothetical protein
MSFLKALSGVSKGGISQESEDPFEAAREKLEEFLNNRLAEKEQKKYSVTIGQ